jgi:hypothetical protein
VSDGSKQDGKEIVHLELRVFTLYVLQTFLRRQNAKELDVFD